MNEILNSLKALFAATEKFCVPALILYYVLVLVIFLVLSRKNTGTKQQKGSS
jgi:hypothetical protein